MSLDARQRPQALYAEQSVLSACLISRKAVETVLTGLRCEEFFFESHQAMYRGIAALAAKKTVVDEVTLAEELRTQGTLDYVGGVKYLKQIYNVCPTSALVEHYMAQVSDAALRRDLIDVGNNLVDQAFESPEGVDELLSNFGATFAALQKTKAACEVVPAQQAFSEQREELVNRVAPPLIRLNQPDLDEILMIHPGDLIIVAGIFNTGKSATMLNWLLSACMHDRGVQCDLITLEMTRRQNEDRMLAAYSNLSLTRVANRTLYDDELERALPFNEILGYLPLRIIDGGFPHVEAIRSYNRISRKANKTELVFIDQLGQIGMRGRAENDNLKLGHIVKELKQSARENENSIILLHQLNRKAEDTGRPEVSQLRGSGIIAEDADAVVLIYNPDRKRSNAQGVYEDEIPLEWIIPRQRNGPKGVVKRTFRRSTQKIFEWSDRFDDDDAPADNRSRSWN